MTSTGVIMNLYVVISFHLILFFYLNIRSINNISSPSKSFSYTFGTRQYKNIHLYNKLLLHTQENVSRNRSSLHIFAKARENFKQCLHEDKALQMEI